MNASLRELNQVHVKGRDRNHSANLTSKWIFDIPYDWSEISWMLWAPFANIIRGLFNLNCFLQVRWFYVHIWNSKQELIGMAFISRIFLGRDQQLSNMRIKNAHVNTTTLWREWTNYFFMFMNISLAKSTNLGNCFQLILPQHSSVTI